MASRANRLEILQRECEMRSFAKLNLVVDLLGQYKHAVIVQTDRILTERILSHLDQPAILPPLA